MIDKLKNNKDLLFKSIIIAIGCFSLYTIYTSNIYLYENFTFESLSLKMWLGMAFYIVFCLLVIYKIYLNSKDIKNYVNRIKYLGRNISLLIMITLLLIYKIGNSIITLYNTSNTIFNYVIYVVFALVFIGYVLMLFLINTKYNTK